MCLALCGAVPNQPIDAPVRFVTQVGLVGISFAGLEAGRRRVVLHDEVVPVDKPDVAIGPHLGGDGRSPFVVAGHQVPGIARAKAGPFRANDERGNQVPGRFGDERRLVPVLGRIRAGRI